MWEFMTEYGLFLAKTLTVLVAVLIAALGVAGAVVRARGRGEDGHIEVRKLNHRFDAMRDALHAAALDEREYKRWRKAERKAGKARRGRAATDITTADAAATGAAADKTPRRVFVLGFHGDIRAHAVRNLREEISALLTLAEPEDSVVVRLRAAAAWSMRMALRLPS